MGGPVGPSRLVVLSHGLYGRPTHLRVLQHHLCALGGADLLVHQAVANHGRTRDGVAAGGARLAEEVRRLVDRHPSLSSLVLVGNSLGGLYVRYAAGQLFEDGKMAGLRPESLLTIGSPHLGVRRHTFLPLPPQVQPAAWLVAGRTADDLMLRDADDPSRSLLAEMAASDSRFGRALAAFERRCLYANLQGDFMVPFGTASIEPGWGSGLSDSWRLRHLLSRVGPVSSVDERVLRGESDGIGVVWLRNESTIEGVVDSVHSSAVELDMCRQLNRVEWTKVGVGFAGVTSLMPMGHNKLAAVNREGWRKIFQWIEQSDDGEPIMEHAARQIVSPSS